MTTAGDGDDQKMEEHAEAVDLHHVRESEAGRLRHIPGGEKSGDGAAERDQAQQFLALFLIDQRIEQHDQDAEGRQDQLGQDADVVGALRNRLRNRLQQRQVEQGADHCPTTLLTTCVNGVSAACTAGSIAPSHRIGATPITSAAAAQGQTAAFSKPKRSGSELFTGCVTLP